MTKNYRWNDEKVKELLRELPEIKDIRSKEQVWHHIQYRKRKKRYRWVIPSIAALASLLFLISVLPRFFYQDNQSIQMSDASFFEKNHPQEKVVELAPSSQEESKGAIPFSLEKDSLDQVVESHVVKEETSNIVTIGFLDRQSDVIIPVSFLSNENEPAVRQIQGILREFNHEMFGFEKNELENVQITEEDRTVSLMLDQQDLEALSYDEKTFKALLQETFRWQKYEKVNLYTNEQPGVQLPRTGKIFEVDIEQLLKKAYFLFNTDRRSYLVPTAKSYETVDEAFQAMKNGDHQVNKSLIPTILPSLMIEKVEKEDNLLTITVNKEDMDIEKETLLIMIEAMLLTAKEFGYDYVKFEGLDKHHLMEYDLSEPIKVPYSPNPLYVYDFS